MKYSYRVHSTMPDDDGSPEATPSVNGFVAEFRVARDRRGTRHLGTDSRSPTRCGAPERGRRDRFTLARG
jgi:hypothetical protein